MDGSGISLEDPEVGATLLSVAWSGVRGLYVHGVDLHENWSPDSEETLRGFAVHPGAGIPIATAVAYAASNRPPALLRILVNEHHIVLEVPHLSAMSLTEELKNAGLPSTQTPHGRGPEPWRRELAWWLLIAGLVVAAATALLAVLLDTPGW